MIGPANAYQPDYAVAPGTILAERLEAHDMSYADFARRCGRSPKLISEIVAGKAPVEPETALQFEKVTGVGRSYLAWSRSRLPTPPGAGSRKNTSGKIR